MCGTLLIPAIFLVIAVPLVGLALGAMYLELLLHKQPLPKWTKALRVGWHLVALGFITWQCFPLEWVHRLCLFGWAVASVAWMIAFSQSRATPKGTC
jgi:hypothetical protein